MPIPTPRQAAEELARRSLSDFARTMIPALDLTPFHRSYYDTLDRFARGEIRRLIVSIPPQHGKSLGSSVLLPAYLLGRQPDRRIALASYNLRLASRFNRQIQRLMDASAYRSIFPRTRLKRSSAKDRGTLRTAEEFELVGSRGGLLSVGRDGALTGRPVDVFILGRPVQKCAGGQLAARPRPRVGLVQRRRQNPAAQRLAGTARLHTLARGRPDRPDRRPGTHNGHKRSRAATGRAVLVAPTQFRGGQTGPAHERPTRADRASRSGRPATRPNCWSRSAGSIPCYSKRCIREIPLRPRACSHGDRFATYDKLPERTIKKGNYTDTADSGEDYLCSVCYETGTDDTIYITDVLYTPLGMEATEPLVAAMLQRNGTRTARIESNNGGRGFARAVAQTVSADAHRVVPPVPEQGSARAVECDRSGGTHPDARRLASSLERILRRRGLVPPAFPLEPARRRARRSDRHRRDRVRRTGKMYPGGRIQRISPPKADQEPTQTAGIFFRKCRLFTKG